MKFVTDVSMIPKPTVSDEQLISVISSYLDKRTSVRLAEMRFRAATLRREEIQGATESLTAGGLTTAFLAIYNTDSRLTKDIMSNSDLIAGMETMIEPLQKEIEEDIQETLEEDMKEAEKEIEEATEHLKTTILNQGKDTFTFNQTLENILENFTKRVIQGSIRPVDGVDTLFTTDEMIKVAQATAPVMAMLQDTLRQENKWQDIHGKLEAIGITKQDNNVVVDTGKISPVKTTYKEHGCLQISRAIDVTNEVIAAMRWQRKNMSNVLITINDAYKEPSEQVISACEAYIHQCNLLGQSALQLVNMYNMLLSDRSDYIIDGITVATDEIITMVDRIVPAIEGLKSTGLTDEWTSKYDADGLLTNLCGGPATEGKLADMLETAWNKIVEWFKKLVRKLKEMFTGDYERFHRLAYMYQSDMPNHKINISDVKAFTESKNEEFRYVPLSKGIAECDAMIKALDKLGPQLDKMLNDDEVTINLHEMLDELSKIHVTIDKTNLQLTFVDMDKMQVKVKSVFDGQIQLSIPNVLKADTVFKSMQQQLDDLEDLIKILTPDNYEKSEQLKVRMMIVQGIGRISRQMASRAGAMVH